MNKTILAAVLGLGLATSGAAFAQTSNAMSSSAGSMSHDAMSSGSMSHDNMSSGAMTKADTSMKHAKKDSSMSSNAMSASTAKQ
jgi:pentapeptide MXKDX repeat protein